MSEERQRASRHAAVNVVPTGDPSQAAVAAGPTSVSTTDHLTIVTLDEAAATYEGEWVLMRVTGSDPETCAPIGEVLLHHPSRREISKTLRQAHKQDPQVQLAVFPGGIQRRSYEETMALMDRAARGPYKNAHW